MGAGLGGVAPKQEEDYDILLSLLSSANSTNTGELFMFLVYLHYTLTFVFSNLLIYRSNLNLFLFLYCPTSMKCLIQSRST